MEDGEIATLIQCQEEDRLEEWKRMRWLIWIIVNQHSKKKIPIEKIAKFDERPKYKKTTTINPDAYRTYSNGKWADEEAYLEALRKHAEAQT